MADLQSPHDIEVREIVITTPAGKELDITDLIAEFNVYESIFTPILTGSMVIVDAAALFSSLPIVGQEKITGKIVRGDDTKEFTFYTTDIKSINNDNDYTLTYTVELVEEAYLYNAVSLVSQAYEGSVSDIVQRISEDFLKKEVDTEQTSGNYRFVIPNWTPYRALRWLTRRAYNENNVPFVCMNTLYGGMKFRSLQTLFEQESIDTFSYKERAANKTDSQTQSGMHANWNEYARTAFMFRQLEMAPMSELLNNGAYGSRTQLIDTMRKKYQVFDYNYSENFDRQPTVTSTNPLSPNFQIDGRPVSAYPTTTQSNYVHSGLSFGNSHMDYNGDVLSSAPYATAYMNTLNNYRYRVGVPGRLDLSVGKAIDLNINKNAIMTENEQGDVKDTRRSGKHIITTLRHQFSGNSEYSLIMNVARDTMGADADEAI